MDIFATQNYPIILKFSSVYITYMSYQLTLCFFSLSFPSNFLKVQIYIVRGMTMAEAGSAWLTPKEIADRLSSRKAREVQEDLLYGRRTRREILDLVMEAVGCNEYSAEDFLREIVK